MLTEIDYCDYETCVALKELGYPLTSKEVRYEDKAVFVPSVLLYTAQKWLREERHIEVVILSIRMTGAPYYFQVYTEDYVSTDDNNYDSYEEALSAGIKEAVEILKER